MRLPRLFLIVLLGMAPAVEAKPVTIDDLMRLRSIEDVRISPDGKRVANVVSTPSFETAAHEAVLYVVLTSGGAPLLMTHGTRIFNQPPHWTVEFDIYPRGGHVNFEPGLEREYMRRNLDWFSQWLRPSMSKQD